MPNQGNVPADTPVSATITATFTWTHDVPGDAPPSDVYVLQHGGAGWGPSQIDEGAPGAAPAMSPSAQDALFSPRSRSQFRLIQAQGFNGTSDDGLNDPQTVNTPGTRGTSTGYKIVVCHPNGNTVTTPPITLSASAHATRTLHYRANWSYDAVVMDVKITRNGADITSPGKPEVPVMVGKLNQMGVSFSPAPPDVAPPTYQWTIPGERIKDFVETAGNPNATPPTFSTGKKVELPAADLQTTSPKFYWYNGTFVGDSKEVQVAVTVDGETYTLKGRCKVYRPKFNSFTGVWTTNEHKTDIIDDADGLRIQLGGNGSPGIRFTGDVTLPFDLGGSFFIIQLVEPDRGVKDDYSINTVTKKSTDFVLDGILTPGVDSNDSPFTLLAAPYTNASIDDNFEDYLMFRPSGGIRAPIAKLVWRWKAGAKFTPANGNTPAKWDVVGVPVPANDAANITGVDSISFPQWDRNTSEVPTVITP